MIYMAKTTLMNQQDLLENGDDASPPKGGLSALKCLWSQIRVSWLLMTSLFKKEKNISSDVGCSTRSLEGGQGQTSRPWSDLPNDLLFSIASRLGRVECIRFMSVCKGWLHSIKPKSPLGGNIHLKPCLLAMEDSALGWLSLYTPFPSKTYRLRIPELKGGCFKYSKDGWILVSKFKETDPTLFLLNILTGAKFDLPNLIIHLLLSGVCFCSTPGSSDFMIVVMRGFLATRVIINTYRPSLKEGQVEEWTTECYENNSMDIQFSIILCNPIFYKGKFYVLDIYGHLGIFDPVAKTWRIVSDRPDYFLMYPESDPDDWHHKVHNYIAHPSRWHHIVDHNYIAHPSRSNFPYKSFMVDLDGDLISVFVNKRKTEQVHMFRLDCCKMSWEKVNNLSSTGELFVGLSTSISTTQVPYGSWNKLYFPGFKDKTYYYEAYSLETKTYEDPNWTTSWIALWNAHYRFTWIELPILSKWESSIIYSKWKRM